MPKNYELSNSGIVITKVVIKLHNMITLKSNQFGKHQVNNKHNIKQHFKLCFKNVLTLKYCKISRFLLQVPIHTSVVWAWTMP